MSDDPKSKINLLKVPDFKSTIPEHFVAKLSEQERYLVQTLSKMEQENAWLIVCIVEINANAIDTDVRVQKVEQWKERLTSKWTLVIGGLALTVPILLKALVDYLFRHRGP
jgi:23S rRNA pseudoU1915 N3-methylase RlmH